MRAKTFFEQLEDEIQWQYAAGGYDPAMGESSREALGEKLKAYAALFSQTTTREGASAADYEQLAYGMRSLAAMAFQAWDFAIRRGIGPLRDPELGDR